MSADLLVVAVCAGGRCRALRRLHDPDARTDDRISAEVRASAHAVLVRTGCLGACERGCVAATGRGHADDAGTIVWDEAPTGFAMVELPDGAGRLATRIRDLDAARP